MSKKIQYCLNQISVAMTVGLEEMFYNLGKLVAINPFKTICFSLSLTALCGLGLFSFYEEKDLVKLWIPENNDFATNHQWLIHNFPPKIRYQSMVLVDETNILRPDVLRYVSYGNTGCGVFKQGIQNLKDFCLRINIPRLKDCILSFGLKASCQKVPNLTFKVNFLRQKSFKSFSFFFIIEYQLRSTFFVIYIF